MQIETEQLVKDGKNAKCILKVSIEGGLKRREENSTHFVVFDLGRSDSHYFQDNRAIVRVDASAEDFVYRA